MDHVLTLPFQVNVLRWRLQRDSRSLRVYTVEPQSYDPPNHANIAFGVINYMQGSTAEASGDIATISTERYFDLVVFPEVFLPSEALLTVVETLGAAGPSGCIHTGIRPGTGEDFLFTPKQALELCDELKIREAAVEDLEIFERYVNKLKPDDYLNIGAVVAVDSANRIRVGLHLKLVSSKYEHSPFSHRNVKEATLLTLIRIISTGDRILPFTIQPLLCSDALQHDTDLGIRPIEALTAYGNQFVPEIPDHIDLISLATCTPHRSADSHLWHKEFRDGFMRMSTDEHSLRHRSAIVAVSNFRQIPNSERIGGLSGAFLPVPLIDEKHPPFTVTPRYGKSDFVTDEAWMEELACKDSQAHMVCLRPKSDKNIAARVLGFTLHRTLRESNQHYPPRGLTNYQLINGVMQPSGAVIFSDENKNVS